MNLKKIGIKPAFHLTTVCLSLGLTLVVACSSVIPMPTQRHVEWASARWRDADSLSLVSGRALYIQKCSGCHSLFAPGDFTEEIWRKEMSEMNKKAKISTADGEIILRYIITASALSPLKPKD